MGSVQRETVNEALLNIAHYDNLKNLRKLIKNFHNLSSVAQQGDGVALAIYVDLKTCLEPASGVLTDLQRYCIMSVDVNQYTLQETADSLSVTAEAVRQNIKLGVLRISRCLRNGSAYRRTDRARNGPRKSVSATERPAVQAQKQKKSHGVPVPHSGPDKGSKPSRNSTKQLAGQR